MNVQDFLDITQAESAEVASQYLDVCDGNLESAVSLYFDTGGVLTPSRMRSPAPVIPEEESDEAMARRLQREMDEEASRQAVRAADTDYTDQLIGGFGMEMSQASSMRQAEHFNGFTNTGGEDSDPRGLAQLFAPPPYRFVGDLDEAKAHAVSEEKLLMISFNEKADFRSHILNRDVWKKEEVEILMRAFFVLLQVEAKPLEGLADLYKITDIPSIIVVDPRTGRKIATISFDEFSNQEKAHKTLVDFIERHPIDSFYKPIVPTISPSTESAATQPPNVSPTPASISSISTNVPPSVSRVDSRTDTAISQVSQVQPPKSPPKLDKEEEEQAKAVETAHQSVNTTLAQLHAERRRRMEETKKNRA